MPRLLSVFDNSTAFLSTFWWSPIWWSPNPYSAMTISPRGQSELVVFARTSPTLSGGTVLPFGLPDKRTLIPSEVTITRGFFHSFHGTSSYVAYLLGSGGCIRFARGKGGGDITGGRLLELSNRAQRTRLLGRQPKRIATWTHPSWEPTDTDTDVPGMFQLCGFGKQWPVAGVISPFHQLTRKKANKRRTLVKSPVCANYKLKSAYGMEILFGARGVLPCSSRLLRWTNVARFKGKVREPHN